MYKAGLSCAQNFRGILHDLPDGSEQRRRAEQLYNARAKYRGSWLQDAIEDAEDLLRRMEGEAMGQTDYKPRHVS